jgi:hypothetical protein
MTAALTILAEAPKPPSSESIYGFDAEQRDGRQKPAAPSSPSHANPSSDTTYNERIAAIRAEIQRLSPEQRQARTTLLCKTCPQKE